MFYRPTLRDQQLARKLLIGIVIGICVCFLVFVVCYAIFWLANIFGNVALALTLPVLTIVALLYVAFMPTKDKIKTEDNKNVST